MTILIPEDNYDKYCYNIPCGITGKWIKKQYEDKKIIPVKDLIDGEIYVGDCRNSSVAIWVDEIDQFIYRRSKCGSKFLERIDHVEIETSYDIFAPHYVADKRYKKLTDDLKEGLVDEPNFIKEFKKRTAKWGKDTKRIKIPC